MTTIQSEDGRLLVARTPPGGLTSGAGGFFPNQFPPMWSDGERYPNAATDGLDGVLASFDRIYRSQPILAGVIDMIAFRAATLPFGAFTANADNSRTPIPRSDSLATLLTAPQAASEHGALAQSRVHEPVRPRKRPHRETPDARGPGNAAGHALAARIGAGSRRSGSPAATSNGGGRTSSTTRSCTSARRTPSTSRGRAPTGNPSASRRWRSSA